LNIRKLFYSLFI